jgi:hypothetical protein
MIINKENLHKRFTESLEALGAYFGDESTLIDEKVLIAEGHDMDDYTIVAMLPGGDHLAICTSGADYVVNVLGEGGRYGFACENNPTVTDKNITEGGGHDFAVIRGRFIVDPWYAISRQGQGVYDLQSKADREAILRTYGDAGCWEWYDPEQDEYIKMNDPALPKERLVSYPDLSRQRVLDDCPSP